MSVGPTAFERLSGNGDCGGTPKMQDSCFAAVKCIFLVEWARFFQVRDVMKLLRNRSNFFALQKSSTLFVVEAE
jgi:hypothetical protein